jgi:hypothetical protein
MCITISRGSAQAVDARQGPRRANDLPRFPSDAFQRTLLVDRMVKLVAEIRAGQKPLTPLLELGRGRMYAAAW